MTKKRDLMLLTKEYKQDISDIKIGKWTSVSAQEVTRDYLREKKIIKNRKKKKASKAFNAFQYGP